MTTRRIQAERWPDKNVCEDILADVTVLQDLERSLKTMETCSLAGQCRRQDDDRDDVREGEWSQATGVRTDPKSGRLRLGGHVLLCAGALAVPTPASTALSGDCTGLDGVQPQRGLGALRGIHR